MKQTFTTSAYFKADAIGKTKNGKKFVLCVLDFSKDIERVKRLKREDRNYKINSLDFGTEDVGINMDVLKELIKTEKKLKDVKLLIFTIPKEQAMFKFTEDVGVNIRGEKVSRTHTLFDIVKEYANNTLTLIVTEEGPSRKITEAEKYPFDVEVKIV